METATFDLTPDPKVHIALTHTPMQPLDALCELIDNSIDSFQFARLQGNPVDHPLVTIDLPRSSELNKGYGAVRIRDNGPGLDSEMAEKAIRAGFSGNNSYDTLGLFGMGFNISTGKLGQVTRFLTKRREDKAAIEVEIDLENIRESRNYRVPFNRGEDPEFGYGTLVEISKWWPEGNPNNGFIRKLVQYGVSTIRREIGRRYATILGKRNIRIVVNGEPCEQFEHCTWADSRYVERRNHGKIPAVFRFDEVIGNQKRCSACSALVPPGINECPACGSSSMRTIQERIRGWVGIQRFDHDTDFGIDLIRNGRAIRLGEKSAFFEYIDEFKKTIKDYPIDSPYGRIAGEVHLDHVPVDFLKQDFQRSSPEWQRAISFLRGDTPLQPGKMKPGETNTSPVFQLFQGYRRVRTPGKTDMYMGYWDRDTGGPKRISRDVEEEYYQKFKQRVPGYYDDSEWWKLVEQADARPLEELVDCPQCGAQNLQGHEICTACDYILAGKTCIEPGCGQVIPQSAITCPHCGVSQVLEIQEPWTCQVCGRRNSAGYEICRECSSPRGMLNPLSRDHLVEHSNKADDLSLPGCSIQLVNGDYSAPIDVDTYVTSGPILPPRGDKPIPLLTFKGDRIEIFLDKTHQLFKVYKVRPEQMIASEVALFLYDSNRRFSVQQYLGQHSLSNLEWAILNYRWSNELKDSAERVKNDILFLFTTLKERLPDLLGEQASDFYEDLNEDQKKQLVENIIGQGLDISELGKMKANGKYLRYIDIDTLVDIFRREPGYFFDGNFWKETYNAITGLSANLMVAPH